MKYLVNRTITLGVGVSKYPLICFLCLTAAVPVVHAANLRLNIEGLEGQLNQNVRVQLSNISQDEVVPNGRFRARVEKAIKEGLKPLGYYQPTVEFSYEEKTPPARSVLTAKVTPGEPILLKGVNVELQGGAKTDPDYEKMLKQYTPKLDTVQNDGEYEEFKGRFSSLAVRKGYFDAMMEKSQLGISLDHHAAYWDFDFNSGERYRFGAISYSGSQIREDYLNNLAPFKKGEYYTSEQLAEFNRRLAETGWFSSAIVTPRIVSARKDNSYELPMEAVMTPRAKNFIELGGGYATDVGPRVKTTWNKPWINSRGQSLTSNISLSQPEQLIDASYKIPLKANPLEQYYAVQGALNGQI